MNRKRLVASLAILLALAAVVFAAMLWSLAAPLQMSIGQPPADLDAQAVEFKSDSGATVHACWCPTANSRGAILLLPGMRGNRLQMIDRAHFLRRAGYSCLLVDLQATGETRGAHVTFGWKESRDVLAAVNFIHERNANERVAIIGSSLGGAAALLAAPPLKSDALILEGVYPTIEVATANRLAIHMGSSGRMLTPLLLKPMRAFLGASPEQLRPIDHIADVDCPVLIISGEKDRHTTVDDTKLLFERARSPKELWLIPNVGHFDLCQAAPKEYETRVLAFLEQMSELK